MRTVILLAVILTLFSACGGETPSLDDDSTVPEGGYEVILNTYDPEPVDGDTLRKFGVTRAVLVEPDSLVADLEWSCNPDTLRWLWPDQTGFTEVFSGGGDERSARYKLWREFALGRRVAMIRRMGKFFEQGEPTEFARRLAPVLRELAALADVVGKGAPRHDGVAILQNAGVFGRDTSLEIFRLLEDVGVEYRFLTTEQVEQGALETEKITVLWLADAPALSEGLVEILRGFVEGGGVVIADRFDSGGSRSRQDALFGIARGEAIPLDFRHRGMPVASGTVRLAGGVPEDEFGTVPVVVRRRLGEGFTVYLNLDIEGYRDARLTPAGGRRIRELVAGFLSEAGIQPGVSVLAGTGGPIDRILRVSYADAEGTVLFVMRNLDVREGKDPLMANPEGNVAGVRVLFREPVRVTNLRTGEDLGTQAMVEDHLMPLEPLIYRLGP